jgi:hypothetical protein
VLDYDASPLAYLETAAPRSYKDLFIRSTTNPRFAMGHSRARDLMKKRQKRRKREEERLAKKAEAAPAKATAKK